MTSAAETIPKSAQVRVIEPESGLAFPDLREVWDYRDLLYFLVRRDFVVRYKQTIAGLLWSVLQPLGFTVVFSVFLGVLADVPSRSGIAYPIFALTGLTMWLFFSKALQTSAESTVSSADLLSKIYFPRILIPLAALMASAVDFIVALGVLIVAMFIYGEAPGLEILALPPIVALAMATALGGGLWFSALFVRYRDIQHLLAFLLLAGLFMTPIVYPFELVPDHLQPLYAINPMVGVIELFRWAMFGSLTASLGVIAIPVVTSILTIVTGALYFRHAERTFADVI